VLDEGHLLEMEIMKLYEFSVSKKHWKKYLNDFRIIDYGYHDIEKWIDFLIELEAKMIASLGDLSAIKQLVMERQNMYNWRSSNIIKTKTKATNTKITDYLESNLSKTNYQDSSAINELEIELEVDERIIEYLAPKINPEPTEEELQARGEIMMLSAKIDAVLSNPKNWIIYNIKKDEYDVVERVEFKPLNISPYCKSVFDRCSKTLIMSATILNHNTFSNSVGLNPNDEVYPSLIRLSNRKSAYLSPEYSLSEL
jgi:ATP-dependent DNA helicase DinG